MTRWTRTLAVCITALATTTAALAQIRIGQTAGFTGPVAAGVKENLEGARLYLDAVNARGGINGRQIELVSLDDQFDPKLTVENATRLIDQGVLALFLTRGTPNAQAVLPLLTRHGVPLIGPSTGAMTMHEPVHPWVFNVRASYQREAERAVHHLAVTGMDRLAIIQQDDSFGADAAIGALKGLSMLGKKPIIHEKYDRTTPDFNKIVPAVVSQQAQAVLFLGSAGHVVEGIARLRSSGSAAQVVTLSNNASAGFVKALKAHARGVVVSQVFPHERQVAVPLIKEATDLARARGHEELTPSMLEGFAAAKVLVAGLRRAGKDLSRSGLRNALESLGRVDIGGMEVSYSSGDHTGLDYADLAIITADGRFRR